MGAGERLASLPGTPEQTPSPGSVNERERGFPVLICRRESERRDQRC